MAVSYLLCVLVLAAELHVSWQVSLPTDFTYQAGVVEFQPSLDKSAKDRVKKNMYSIKEIIESDAAKDLDILVFPEYVLNNMEWKTYVPDPNLGIAPCDIPDYDFFLTEISCSVRSRGLYVVINVVEKALCADRSDNCDASGINTYNTNVVLDRHGRVISRYRKTHLYRYEWYSTNVLAEPELATFTTDFGVTFGHFICFDMLFYEPAQLLIRNLNITDIIYPTYWFSELPFLTAVQLQEGWAYANNVNLLAADASNPAGQNTGSGIYAGKLGRITAAIFENPTTQLLKASVPKHAHNNGYQLPPSVQSLFVPQLETPRYTKVDLLRDYNVDIFSTKLLASDFISAKETLCHGAFCCKFDVLRILIRESASYAAYRFRLAAYSGFQTTHQRIDPSSLSICAVIACTNSELYSCGHIFPADTVVGNKYYFSAVNISGAFDNSERRLIMPSSVDAQLMPLPVSMYEMSQELSTNSTLVSIALTSPKSDLLTFGIWSNYYSTAISKHNLDLPMLRLKNNAAVSVWTSPRCFIAVSLTVILTSFQF